MKITAALVYLGIYLLPATLPALVSHAVSWDILYRVY